MNLKEIEIRKAEILDESANADLATLKLLNEEMDDLNAYAEELRKKEIAEIEKRKEIADKINNDEIEANIIQEEVTKTNLVEQRKGDVNMNTQFDSVEYRNAFMNFAMTGNMNEEFRAVAMTSGNSAVIPTTVLNQIVEKLESYGNILPLVTKMNYPAGVAIPTSELASPAIWTTETDMSNTGVAVEGKVTGSVTFAAYPLVKAIGLSFLARVQTLSAFEAAIANNVSAAMAKAMESAIINGSGSGQPKGILKETAAKTVELSKTLAYEDIVKIKKAIPSAYRTGAVLVMNEATFYTFLAIVDKQGQPVARMNQGIDGNPSFEIFGTRVIVTDWMKDYDSAAKGETVAFVVQLDKYVMNTAYDIDLVTYIDNATRNKVYQSVAAVDGKLVDKNGLVFINKSNA
jgi:phage capsid family|nr:MAG TPA: major capsid protein [Caudoviricetes sp.]